ncbi:twin arginine-targeting protein translocase TatC [Campylobacter sputorum subsp. bubulus]|uniref:Sec-independent protein translocase protein TatC n=1 Tax=Campylobacter sputorum subsp. sputorum TaxID=32024 RepID=A0A381DIV5_9BACT|nr:twin-arginine translocase subunit TatC [Campylobacter sputorum]ASM35572.1 twin arginine translocation system, TatC protein [Campylobacter sputorum aubsp. sputorum RM3237]KAB0582695.1 twin-arginine translocase subunit TatC [Campylobacter sputorum subsp. sputorum]QEL05763.1 twin arginine translocation system, TatC protein [Campylobacter sputorum subsp. sputorum]SUX08131.1 twin arginine-targeting protein translocase TatC [Campylobacter sputorum subsp. bubulus]SUX10540.1 twin arginine-targeting
MFEDLKPHLIELRKRLFISCSSIFVMFFVCFSFWNPILSWMTAPLVKILPQGSDIIFTQVQEPFFTAMKVSFFAGLVVSMPIIFWQFWLFVSPGLYDNEKKYVLPFVFFATFFFIAGSSFCYYVVIPIGFKFLINFGGQLFTALPSIGEYVGFFTKLIVAFGISFELPVVTFFLAKIGLVDYKALLGFFRYAIIIIFVFAAIVTPPDVISQILMALPLVLLYVLSILVVKWTCKTTQNETADDEQKDGENLDD